MNVNEYLSIYKWMIKNNKTFKGITDLEEAPKPIIIEDKDNRSNTDDVRDP